MEYTEEQLRALVAEFQRRFPLQLEVVILTLQNTELTEVVRKLTTGSIEEQEGDKSDD